MVHRAGWGGAWGQLKWPIGGEPLTTAVTPETEGDTESVQLYVARTGNVVVSGRVECQDLVETMGQSRTKNGWSGGRDGSSELMAISALKYSGVMDRAWWGSEGRCT